MLIPTSLTHTLAALRVGAPIVGAGLTVVPVHLPPEVRPAKTYWTLTEACARRLVRITEIGKGVVPALAASVEGPAPVLFAEGDLLLGGRQNRIVNVSVLAPAGRTTRVPVSCVERGRWSGCSPMFEPARTFASPTLRACKSAAVTASLVSEELAFSSDQNAVWTEVDRELASSVSDSVTQSVTSVYDTRVDDIEPAVSVVEPLLEGGARDQTIGLVAFGGNEFLGADVFDRPGTFRRLAPRLVRGYAVETLGRAHAEGTTDATRIKATERLSHLTWKTVQSHDSPGLGTDHRIDGDDLVGFALEHRGRVVHLALFPKRFG